MHSTLDHIYNFLRIDDQLSTGGMPAVGDFAAIGQAGFEAVINLALPTSDNALAHEGALVSAQGMTYVHMPVDFKRPRAEDFQRFTQLLELWKGHPVFVHCAANMRVSAFVFLHRLRHGADRVEAERDLRKIWEPDGVWREFVNQQLDKLGQPPL
jgi:uncharacterized protein (TIGR01244 family)